MKAAYIACGICGVVALCLGIAAAVLGSQGYFDFKDPCVGVESFEIKDMDMETADGNHIMGLLDSFTMGLASQFVPTQATITIELILEVNNTNSFDLEMEQDEAGVIQIDAHQPDSHLDNDLKIGEWQLPSTATTLKSQASSHIPVTVTAKIDLLSSEAAGLTGDLMTGADMVFRVQGEMQGRSWVPGFTGQNTLTCLAKIDNLIDAVGNGAEVTCTQTMRVGSLLETTKEETMENEVDPSCYA